MIRGVFHEEVFVRYSQSLSHGENIIGMEMNRSCPAAQCEARQVPIAVELKLGAAGQQG